MRPSIGLSNRIYRAWKYLESETGEEVRQARLGDMVAAELGRATPFTQPAVTGWLKKGVQDIDTLWGIAQACGVRAEWLAFGTPPMLDAKRPNAPAELEENPRPRVPLEETTNAAVDSRGAGKDGSKLVTPSRRPGSR
jgi:hypothetical protein